MAFAAASSDTAPRPILGGNRKFLIAGAVIALAVAYLVIQGIQSSSVYFVTVSELRTRGAAAQHQVVRVSGTLVPGTLQRNHDGLTVEFQIADQPKSAPLPVVYRGGQVPDIIGGDNIQIVAEGQMDKQGTFEAKSILAKCPSRLQNAPPTERSYGQSAA